MPIFRVWIIEIDFSLSSLTISFTVELSYSSIEIIENQWKHNLTNSTKITQQSLTNIENKAVEVALDALRVIKSQ